MLQTSLLRRDKPDWGLQTATSISRCFRRLTSRNRHQYAPLSHSDTVDLSSRPHSYELESRTPTTPLKPKSKRKVNIPFRKIWTPNVVIVLLTHFLLAGRMFLHPSFPQPFPLQLFSLPDKGAQQGRKLMIFRRRWDLQHPLVHLPLHPPLRSNRSLLTRSPPALRLFRRFGPPTPHHRHRPGRPGNHGNHSAATGLPPRQHEAGQPTQLPAFRISFSHRVHRRALSSHHSILQGRDPACLGVQGMVGHRRLACLSRGRANVRAPVDGDLGQ